MTRLETTINKIVNKYSKILNNFHYTQYLLNVYCKNGQEDSRFTIFKKNNSKVHLVTNIPKFQDNILI